MKICVAQTRPVKGDIHRNIENHKALIDLAVSNEADVVIFPELSLTGYEPKLAKELATDQDDSRLDDFQKIGDAKQTTIGEPEDEAQAERDAEVAMRERQRADAAGHEPPLVLVGPGRWHLKLS